MGGYPDYGKLASDYVVGSRRLGDRKGIKIAVSHMDDVIYDLHKTLWDKENRSASIYFQSETLQVQFESEAEPIELSEFGYLAGVLASVATTRLLNRPDATPDQRVRAAALKSYGQEIRLQEL